MWNLQTSLFEPAEPTPILQMRVAGKRTLTAALPKRSAPAVAGAKNAAAPEARGEAGEAANEGANEGANEAGADPFWFAGSGSTAADRLPQGVQQQMEQAFGADFSDVRIGVGSEASERGALAFARGNELQFAPGQYDPTSAAGLELIGHELAHVVQQRQGRAASAQGKGGVVEDAALEAEADLAGARAARGLSAGLGAGLGASSSAASLGGAIQRKATAIGVLDRAANHSVTLQLLRSLITQHALQHLLESVERVMLWWGDAEVQSLAQAVIDRVMSASVKEAVQAFSAVVTPYLAVLSQVRTYYKLLPEVVQNLMVFGMGSGMVLLLNRMTFHKVTSWVDWIANGIFLDSGSFIGKIEWVSKQLFDLCNTPASWAYNLLWSKIRGPLGSAAPTPAVAAAEAIFAAPAATPTAAPAQALAPAAAHEPEAEAEDEAAKAAKAAKAKKAAEEAEQAAKRDLRYLWLDVDSPKLDRFEHDKRKTGGLVLPFQFGVNIFGTKLKAKGDKQELHIPWGGGFAVDLKNIEIDTPLKFDPIFSVGKVLLTSVKVTEKGLEKLDISVSEMKFADGAVTLSELSAKYLKDKGLSLRGAAGVKVHDKDPITTFGTLDLDGNGDFEKGSLDVSTPASFTIIDPHLIMKSPKLRGSIDKSHNIDLSLSSDIASKFSFVDIDAKGAHLDYKKGKGHELSGGVNKLTVKLGEHVTLSGDTIDLSSKGIHAKSLGLEYRHDPSAAGRASEELQTIGGIPPSLLSFTGINSLVIGGTVEGLRIGPPPKPVALEGARAAVPQAPAPAPQAQHPQAQAPAAAPAQAEPAPALGSAESNFHVDNVKPKVSKIGAKAFGMRAELDLEKPEVTLGGEVSYKPDIPSVGFEAHFLPGLALAGSLAPKVDLSAAISGKGSMPRKDAFALTGTVEAKAKLSLMASLNLQVGTSLIAALRAGVFAEGSLSVAAKAAATGVVEVDHDSHTVRASAKDGETPRVRFSADADVTASVGVVVSGHAFLVFDRELYRYTFKEWKFGLYHLEGEVGLDGTPKIDDGASRFVKEDKKPDELGVTKALVPEWEAKLKSKEAIQGSAAKRKELLRDLRANFQGADQSTIEELNLAQRAAIQFENDYASHRMRLVVKSSQVGPSNIQEDLQGLEVWRAKLDAHQKAITDARDRYRLLQLLLVKDINLSDAAIEDGELDIAEMEKSIRAAAAVCDADKVQVTRSGAAASRPDAPSAPVQAPSVVAASPAPSLSSGPPAAGPASGQGGPPSSNQDQSNHS